MVGKRGAGSYVNMLLQLIYVYTSNVLDTSIRLLLNVVLGTQSKTINIHYLAENLSRGQCPLSEQFSLLVSFVVPIIIKLGPFCVLRCNRSVL